MFAVLLARSAPFSGEEDEEVIFRADCKLWKLVAWLKQASAESSNDNFADAIWLEYHATLIAKFAHRVWLPAIRSRYILQKEIRNPRC